MMLYLRRVLAGLALVIRGNLVRVLARDACETFAGNNRPAIQMPAGLWYVPLESSNPALTDRLRSSSLSILLFNFSIKAIIRSSNATSRGSSMAAILTEASQRSTGPLVPLLAGGNS